MAHPSSFIELSLTRARTLSDILDMRRVRNSCREFMTYDTSYISVPRQVLWYLGTYGPRVKFGSLEGWLAWHPSGLAGYGLVSLARERWWVTGGLLPEYRDLGLGVHLFDFLTGRAMIKDGESWLTVYASNERARRVYEKLGYKHVSNEDGDEAILWMRRRG